MQHLLPFQLFESHASGLTPDQEAFLNACAQGTWSVNQQTGLIDVDGDFNCSRREFNSLQGVSFGHVSGDFSMLFSNLLTTLAGAPLSVGGGFYCWGNQLTSLVGAPQTVGEGFLCNRNQLTSLEGAPQTVGGSFSCENNQLTSLAGAPQTVDGNFYCVNNRLTSLEGAPQTVGERFHCDAFFLKQGEWNPAGWVKILSTGEPAAQKLMKTLPYWDPAYWLELHRSNRRKFNDIWLECRQDPQVRKTKLFQEVEAALSGRALKNLEDLQDLRDFGL